MEKLKQSYRNYRKSKEELNNLQEELNLSKIEKIKYRLKAIISCLIDRIRK